MKPDSPEPARRPSPSSRQGEAMAVVLKAARMLQRKDRCGKQVRAHFVATIMEAALTSDSTKKGYLLRLKRFGESAERFELEAAGVDELDKRLVDYCDLLALHGEDQDSGTKLLAALECFQLSAVRGEALAIPRFRRILQCWEDAAPARKGRTLPEEAAYAMAGYLIHAGEKDRALYMMVCFAAYLRPSECLMLRVSDLVEPTACESEGHTYHAIFLAPRERSMAAASGFYREKLALDSAREPCLGELLASHADTIARESNEERRADMNMWRFSAQEMRVSWRKAADALHLDFAETPDQCRHGGRSRDRLLRLRSAPEIQRREGGASSLSLRFDEGPQRLQETIHMMDPRVVRYGVEMRKRFKEIFEGQSMPALHLPRRAGPGDGGSCPSAAR